MEWFEYPYPRPELMNKWSFARHSEVMMEKFETEDSRQRFDDEVHSLCKSFQRGKAHADLSSLFECLYAAAKMEEREDPTCKQRTSFTQLYSEGLHNLLENYIHNPPCWKTTPSENDIILYCMALTADLAKSVIKSLQITNTTKTLDIGRVNNAIAIVRTLTTTMDKDTLFHKLVVHRPLPPWVLFNPRQYTKALNIMPRKSSSHLEQGRNSTRHVSKDEVENLDSSLCGCGKCSTYSQESYIWINILVEHFGHGSGIAGFDVFLDILMEISLLEIITPNILELCESVLQFLSKVAEFLKDDKRFALINPLLRVQGALSRWYQTNQLGDESLLGTVTLIARHLRLIFCFLLPSSAIKVMMMTTNQLLQDLFISFQSSETKGITITSTLPPSPCSTLKGTEKLHVAKIDAPTARALKEEVSKHMCQQLTKFVSEFLAMLLPTLQQSRSGTMMQIQQQYESDGAGGGLDTHHRQDIFYPHPPSLATDTEANKMAELSPMRSSAALGGTMRNVAEILSQAHTSSAMSLPSSACSPVSSENYYN